MRSRNVDSMNDLIREYTNQLNTGRIQEAYRGIMSFMSDLRTYLTERYPNYVTGSLYFGYMDMTYFAFSPTALRDRKLKIAIVYLHKESRFEVWLGAINRKVQAEYIEFFRLKNIGQYKLSQVSPGVDSILESILSDRPDFDNPEELKKEIERKTIEFAESVTLMLNR